jgi:hypothetical protein
MTDSTDDRDQLIADLLEEAHGLRMKLEDFSLYTEARVAEFVVARKALTEERDTARHLHELAQRDIEVFRHRQVQMQHDLIEMDSMLRALEERVALLTKQRDNARRRAKANESPRIVRLVARLRRRLSRR